VGHHGPVGSGSVLAEELRAVGRAAGLDAVGIAPAGPFEGTRRDLEERKAAGLHGGMHFTYGDPGRSTDPARALLGARSLVVGGRRYRQADAPPPAGRPVGRVARYARRDHYAELRTALGAVAGRLREAGWRARVLCDDNDLVDREAARRAGLGWYGKSANLLLPGQGSWFVLGSVLTDAPLPSADEPVADGCGACVRCLEACPTGAIVAPGVVDAGRCLAWRVQAPGPFPVEHRTALGDRLYGCDDCQEVCPPNRRHDRLRPPPPGDDEPWVDLLDLLAATDDELLDRHGRWYVPRRQARYLRRNALVVLANVADGRAPGVAAALAAALASDDPLVRGHAAWAAGRLGRDDLAASALAHEADPGVLSELAAGRAAAPR
jgi:epoxyqueuosine reductase